MTIQELNTRQGWTLSQKIDHAVGTVEAFLSRTGKVPYVSFSGGKDSTVLLDIVRRFVDRDIKAVFCNTGNEYPEIFRFVRSTENVTIIRPGITVKEVIGKYGFPLISKEQAHGIRQAKTTKSEKLLSIRLHGTDKTRGYTSGKIADLILLYPSGGFHSLCIEFKTPSKSSRQTPTQKEWQALAEAHGNKYIVCRSLEDFQQVIRAYIPRLCW